MWFVAQASLKVAKKLMIEMGSVGAKKCAFISDLVFTTIVVKKYDTVAS